MTTTVRVKQSHFFYVNEENDLYQVFVDKFLQTEKIGETKDKSIISPLSLRQFQQFLQTDLVMDNYSEHTITIIKNLVGIIGTFWIMSKEGLFKYALEVYIERT